MNKLLMAGVAAALLASSTGAHAHHSFAMFDRTKVVSLQGTVREFQWTNPHSWVQLVVKQPDGTNAEWSLEALGPNVLRREGWKRTSIKAGDQVTAYFNPTRDGSHGGNLVKVVLADGQTVGGEEP